MSEPIAVRYEYVDGAHFFTSDDPKVKGLCAASADLETAYNEVSVQLTALVEHETGERIDFIPAVSPQEFEKWLAVQQSTAIAGIHSLAKSEWAKLD